MTLKIEIKEHPHLEPGTVLEAVYIDESDDSARLPAETAEAMYDTYGSYTSWIWEREFKVVSDDTPVTFPPKAVLTQPAPVKYYDVSVKVNDLEALQAILTLLNDYDFLEYTTVGVRGRV